MFWYQFLMIGEKSRQNKYWLHSVHLGTAAQKKNGDMSEKKREPNLTCHFFSETQKDLFRVIRVLKKTKKVNICRDFGYQTVVVNGGGK